jgi:hypothetical protein
MNSQEITTKNNFYIQDPRTFDLPNKSKVKKVIELFLSKQKNEFLEAYFNLNNTDKFYVLSVIVLESEDTELLRYMLLDDLKKDITEMTLLIKPPRNLDLSFGYPYKGYYDQEIYDRLSFDYFEIKEND